MSAPVRDSGSFRDPSGHVFLCGERVVRTVNSVGMKNFRNVESTGVLSQLAELGYLIPTRELGPQDIDFSTLTSPRGERPCLAIEHPRLPVISYPYEWTFSQLKDAAITHLDLQIAAFDRNVVLTDATPYNMQFSNNGLLHIDVLSLRPYREGEYWAGYNQFCRLFLMPLLLEAWRGVPLQPLLRGCLDGMQLSDAQYLLPATKRFLSINGFLHITVHANSERSNSSRAKQDISTSARPIPRKRYRAMLTEMREWIKGLQTGRKTKSFWNEYSEVNSYSQHMHDVKKDFVARFVRHFKVVSLWDIGGNTGDFSTVALGEGARHATVIDGDLDSLEQAYARRKDTALHLLPLVMDCADPSACGGWNQQERKGLNQRATADAILALAVVHHLAIGRNIPLQGVIEWLVSLAPRGIIEFVPIDDPMVTQMLMFRDVVFADYDEVKFRSYLGHVARIVEEHRFSDNGRL
ncbi:MAG: class I SAM-dependent methyltransferase, partial [Hyphomicrobiaceae bacterium]